MSATQASTTRRGSMGFIPALQLLLIGLKLSDYLDWSWIWVLSPFLAVLPLAILRAMLEGFVANLQRQAMLRKLEGLAAKLKPAENDDDCSEGAHRFRPSVTPADHRPGIFAPGFDSGT